MVYYVTGLQWHVVMSDMVPKRITVACSHKWYGKIKL